MQLLVLYVFLFVYCCLHLCIWRNNCSTASEIVAVFSRSCPSLDRLLPRPCLLSYLFFSFLLFFPFLVLCTRFSCPICQLLSVHKYTMSYCIMSSWTVHSVQRCRHVSAAVKVVSGLFVSPSVTWVSSELSRPQHASSSLTRDECYICRLRKNAATLSRFPEWTVRL